MSVSSGKQKGKPVSCLILLAALAECDIDELLSVPKNARKTYRTPFERHSHADLPILKPKKAGLNCSVIYLQLKWKTHHQTSKWS